MRVMRVAGCLLICLPLVPGAWAQASRPAASEPGEPVRVGLRLEGGGAVVLDPVRRVLLELENLEATPRECLLELWLPPEATLTGLPERVALPGSTRRDALRGELRVEADRPAGPLSLEVVVRDAETGQRLGRHRLDAYTALGRDFLRLGFEGDPRPRERAQPSQPAWLERKAEGCKAKTVRPGGAGAACLRLAAEGERAACTLFAGGKEVGIEAPIDRFPFLVLMWSGRFVKGTVELAVTVDGRDVVIPLGVDEPLEASGDESLARSWRRLAVPLAERVGKGRAVTGLRLVLARPGVELDLDDVALCREGEPSAGDRLRGLCERFVAMPRGQAAADLRADLATVAAERLLPAERVDHELLSHALALQQELAELPDKKDGEPAGAARFSALVRHQQMLDQTPEQLIALGWNAISTHQRRLEELAGKIAPGKPWREVVELLREKHPSAADLPRVARKNWEDARDFTIRHGLVTVPFAARHGVVRAETEGELSRTYAFGGYGGARRSPEGFTGTFLVSPPGSWMDAEQAEQRLRGNHFAWCRVVALHEMVPGHHLQTVVHEMRPLSPFRRRFYSTLFAEGWALYCEQMLADAGYCEDPQTRFALEQMRLWRAARVVMDCSLQTGLMSKDEAERLFVREAALLPENARAEVARDIDVPTRPLSYYVGFRAITDLEAEEKLRLGDAFDARVFRDRLLSFGPIPLSAVRKGLRP
jgi:hypothetical protein